MSLAFQTFSEALEKVAKQTLLSPEDTQGRADPRLAILVGSRSSREAVKDEILRLREDLGLGPMVGDLVPALEEMAKRILFSNFLAQSPAVLSTSDRWDLLDRLASVFPFLKERGVQKQVGAFLQNLDEFSPTEMDRDAILDVLYEKEPQLSEVGQAVFKMMGPEVGDYSGASLLRQAIDVLEGGSVEKIEVVSELGFDALIIWAWSKKTPLEQKFLDALAPYIEMQDFSAEKIPLGASLPEVEIASYHTPWDGFANLRQHLMELHRQGIEWKKISLRVSSADPIAKRVVRDLLLQWNVPLHDPQLSRGWTDIPEILWWKSQLALWRSKFDVKNVFAIFGPLLKDSDLNALNDLRLQSGINSGASAWKKILGLPPEHLGEVNATSLATLKWSLHFYETFGKAKHFPSQFRDQWAEGLRDALSFLGETENRNIFLLMDEFMDHLVAKRPFLVGRKLSLARFLVFFDEYLEGSARTFSLRSDEGVWLISQDFLLPFEPAHEFALGLNCWELESRRAPATSEFQGDWVENNEKMQHIWARLHFEDSSELRRKEHHYGLRRVLFGSVKKRLETENARKLHIHNWVHSLSGVTVAPLSAELEFLQDVLPVPESIAPKNVSADPSVGWTVHPRAHVDEVLQTSLNQFMASEIFQKRSLRISAFEDYLKCPFIFFVRHVKNAEPLSELEVQAKPQDKGKLLHLIFETVLKANCSSLAEVESVFEKVVQEEKKNSALFRGIYRDSAIYHRILAELLEVTRRWWDFELELRKKFPNLKPHLFEQPVALRLNNGFKLRGRIDRIDILETKDSGFAKKGYFIWDYKTGTASLFNGRELISGLGVQLLGYALGLGQSEKSFQEMDFVGASYLDIGKKVEAKKGIYLKKYQGQAFQIHARNSGLIAEDGFENEKANLLEFWTNASENILAGNFAPKPYHEKLCTFCRYRTFCNYKNAEAAEG